MYGRSTGSDPTAPAHNITGVTGVWGDAKQTKDVPCTTYKTVDTLSFGTVASGTDRVRFNKVTKSGLVTIHSWGAYRG